MVPLFWMSAIAVGAGVFATMTAVAAVSLNGLSRGTVRKLEMRNRSLAERLEKLLRRREPLTMAFRLLLMAALMVVLFCMAKLLGGIEQGTHPGRGAALVTAVEVGVLGYFLVSELVGRHLTGVAAGRYLVGFAFVARVLTAPLLPVLWMMQLVHERIDTWQGERGQEDERATAEDEIMSLVESDAEEADVPNELEEDERRMIRGIFDLDETLVREIMTPRVDLKTVEDSATAGDVRACIIESGHSRIPVFHESVDRIVGVIYSKDLLDDERVRQAGDIREFLHKPLFVPESKNVGDLLADFQKTQIHFAVVLDEYGGTAGIVSIEDVLEEIVGEIRDEYDIHETEPILVRNEDGSVVAEARVALQDVFELLDIELPEKSDCETLGGYITSTAGRIPEAGETVENALCRFQIMDADMRRVLKARVIPYSEEEREDSDE